uniref:G-protein coupled receptors family 1 profile domain-containing protein n=1 Tax=Octopus bimaculoides TaxID=37653 RepID=A0A0L8G834_OCTBM
MECNYSFQYVTENGQLWNYSEIRNITESLCCIDDIIQHIPNIVWKSCCSGSLTHISDIIWLYFPPFLILVGNVTNCLSLVILWRPKLKRNVIRNELIALALSNLFILDFSLLLKYLYSLDINLYTENQIVCKITKWLFDPVGIFNSWLLVLISIQRVTAVMKPILMRNPNNENGSKKQIIILLTICILLESHVLYGHGREYKTKPETNTTILITNCGITNSTYKQFYRYWVILEIFFLCYIPTLFLFTCNILIVLKLRQHYANKELFNNMTQPATINTRKMRAMQNLKLVFYTNTAFIASQTPISLVFLVYEPWDKLSISGCWFIIIIITIIVTILIII